MGVYVGMLSAANSHPISALWFFNSNTGFHRLSFLAAYYA